jgi:hypothetical protein
MPPDVAVLRDALTMLAAFVIGLGLLIALLPVGTCSSCTHCRDERLAQAAQRQRGGAAMCGICRQMIPTGEAHSHNKDDAE